MNNTPQVHSQSPENEQIIFDRSFLLYNDELDFKKKSLFDAFVTEFLLFIRARTHKKRTHKKDLTNEMLITLQSEIEAFIEQEEDIQGKYRFLYDTLFCYWEYVKNSFDAHATSLRVVMKYNKKVQKVILLAADNGDGINAKTTQEKEKNDAYFGWWGLWRQRIDATSKSDSKLIRMGSKWSSAANIIDSESYKRVYPLLEKISKELIPSLYQ